MNGFIDLHRHLDGSVTVDIARKLAAITGAELPEDDAVLRRLLKVPEDCADLGEFLKRFDLPVSLLQTPESISEAVALVTEQAAKEGLVYAELRFAPQLHCREGMTQEEVFLAALKGLRRSPIPANLIMCLMRLPGNAPANRETLELTKKYLVEDGGVVALDIAGAEAEFPLGDYETLFSEAREHGIPFTIHAGEAAGAESVKRAVELGARRIGHGVRSVEDPETVRLLRDRGVTLELCPTSNRLTRAWPDLGNYPLRELLKAGVKVTLNTDDPAVEDTLLPREFALLREKPGLTREEERELFMNAADAAFTSEERKAELRNRWDCGML